VQQDKNTIVYENPCFLYAKHFSNDNDQTMRKAIGDECGVSIDHSGHVEIKLEREQVEKLQDTRDTSPTDTPPLGSRSMEQLRPAGRKAAERSAMYTDPTRSMERPRLQSPTSRSRT
jgi:hypothetical protein